MGRGKWIAVLLLGMLYLTGCGKEMEPPQAEWTLVQETAAVLPDGTRVSLWQSNENDYDFYRLPDGTALLTVSGPGTPEAAAAEGADGFDTLSEDAKRAIQLYFDEQGTLYDLQAELEAAYTDYQESGAEGWQERTVTQETMPVASTSRIISFYTTVHLNGKLLQDYRLGAVFDRETGKKFDLWSLFSVPQETAMERLLDGVTDLALFSELAAAFQPERVIFFQDHVEVDFPDALLPGQEDGYGFTIRYDSLEGALESWAIPTE